MAQQEVHHHLGEHEYSYWPLPVGLAVLLVPLTFIALMVWQKSLLALILGGTSVALFIIGIAGWIYEFFSKGHEEGLGMPAMMFFIVSEVVIFGTMFAGFYMARATHSEIWHEWVPKGINLTIPLILTLILWTSSATIALAEKLFEKGKNALSALFVIFTMLLGIAFTVIHVMEWTHLWHEGFTLRSNMYGTGFYMLTGIHTSHILVGLLTMLVAVFLLLSGKANQHKGHTYIKAITLYWHFVDIMWLLVASSVYLIGSLA